MQQQEYAQETIAVPHTHTLFDCAVDSSKHMDFDTKSVMCYHVLMEDNARRYHNIHKCFVCYVQKENNDWCF
jgi:hypothetical protein